MAQIRTLPITDNRVYKWLIKFAKIKKIEGEAAATVWLSRRVPKQFHAQIRDLYYETKRQEQKK